MSSFLTASERRTLHSLLLAEQILGKRLFQATLAPVRERMRARIGKRLQSFPPPPVEEVERRENLSPEEFQRNYFRLGKPVIFSGAAKDWSCVKNWTLDSLAESHGSKDVLLVNAPGLTSSNETKSFEFLNLRELVKSIRGSGGKYLRFSPLLDNAPELIEAFDLSWFEKMRGGNTFARTFYMFIGGAGERTHLHNDQPCNLYVQVQGEKRWTLVDVADSALLYPEPLNTAYVKSQVSLQNPDLDNQPLFRHAHLSTAVLRAGDIIYVPPFTWHEVENLSESIAFGYRFSSLTAALRASVCFSLLRVTSTNPPVWTTAKYGKTDTNLIWAHAAGLIREVTEERARREASLR